MQYTDEQKTNLESMVAKWQKKLNLQSWKIVIDWDNPAEDDDCAMSVRAVPGRQCATLRIGLMFSQTPADQENTVAHELLHCILEPMWQAVNSALSARMSSHEYTLVYSLLTDHLERTVDALAYIMAPHESRRECDYRAATEQTAAIKKQAEGT